MVPRISYRRYRRPFRHPLRTSRGVWSVREGYLLRVEGAGGTGYGEVAPIPEFGSESLEAAGDFLERLSRNADLAVPAELPCCAFGLSAARAAAGAAAPVAARPSYEVAALLPAGEACLGALAAKAGEGFRTYKWKIGVGAIAAELALLEGLVAALPEGAKLRLDANAGMDRAAAERWLGTLARYRSAIEYLEQPMAVGEEAMMARLSADYGIPIALDESLNGGGRAHWCEGGGWTGPLVVKPALMGAVDALAEGLRPLAGRVVWSSVFETGIGLENALSLADRLPRPSYALGFDTVGAFDDGLNPISLGAGGSLRGEARQQVRMEAIWEQSGDLG